MIYVITRKNYFRNIPRIYWLDFGQNFTLEFNWTPKFSYELAMETFKKYGLKEDMWQILSEEECLIQDVLNS